MEIPGALGDMEICYTGGTDYAHPILMSPQIFKTTGAPVIHDSTFQKSQLLDSLFEFEFRL